MIFTIAIPTYNNAQTLESAIKSCIGQDIDMEYEVLVTDNNSTDQTKTILQKYTSEIRVIYNNKTVSMYENHNICLANAKGDYIIFCHSDDQLLPDALTKFYHIIKKRGFPRKYVIWGRSFFRDFSYNWSHGGFNLNQIASGINALNAFQFGGLTPSGTCYSRNSFVECGGFLKIKHFLAPSDFFTMWKLILMNFEFEMSDRIFFIRYYASIATKFSINDLMCSFEEGISELISELQQEKIDILINHFINSNFYNPIIFKVLSRKRIISTRVMKKKMIKFIIKKPLKKSNFKILKYLFLH